MSSARRITRRRFAALTAAGAALFGGVAWFLRERIPRPRLLDRVFPPGLDRGLPPGALAPAHRRALLALGAVLLPSVLAEAPGPIESMGGILDDMAGAEPGRRAELEAAADYLDARARHAGAVRFTELDLPARRRLVESILGEYSRAPARRRSLSTLFGDGRRTDRLWRHVAQPLLERFYAGPWGWRVVGYPRGRGECSNLVDYQSPPVAT